MAKKEKRIVAINNEICIQYILFVRHRQKFYELLLLSFLLLWLNSWKLNKEAAAERERARE